jgi:hypothetical protein
VSLLLGRLGVTRQDPQCSASQPRLASRHCEGRSLINGAVTMPGRSRSTIGGGNEAPFCGGVEPWTTNR